VIIQSLRVDKQIISLLVNFKKVITQQEHFNLKEELTLQILHRNKTNRKIILKLLKPPIVHLSDQNSLSIIKEVQNLTVS
jgi:hypothetical protein